MTKKLLPSPDLHAATKLSPIASIQQLGQRPKKTESVTNGQSFLKGVAKAKRSVAQKTENTTENNKPAEQVTIIVKAEEEKELDEVKNIDKSKISRCFNNAKRTPWIDTTKTNEITLSPLANIEGIRSKSISELQEITEGKVEEEAKCTCELSSGQCKACQEKIQNALMSGYLYEKGEDIVLNRHWYKVIGSHLYSKNLY